MFFIKVCTDFPFFLKLKLLFSKINQIENGKDLEILNFPWPILNKHVEPIHQASKSQKSTIFSSPYTKQAKNTIFGCMGYRGKTCKTYKSSRKIQDLKLAHHFISQVNLIGISF